MRSDQVCLASHINHVCMAVADIEETINFYVLTFGINTPEVVNIKDQSVKAALVEVGSSQLEFIQPTDSESGVARFIKTRGDGVHHICFEVDNLDETLVRLEMSGINLIDKRPRKGLSGMIAFLHPRSTRGVLIELVDRDTVSG